MFLSPVFYPSTALPVEYRHWLELNPVAYVIEGVRDVVIFGRVPQFLNLGIVTILAIAFAWCGFIWFQKTRRGFADVL
jgi:lipopolysaccharide transport system permease protein